MRYLLILSMSVLLFTACHKHNHSHEHDSNCDHDHSAHSHEHIDESSTHSHEHGEDCDHNHDHDDDSEGREFLSSDAISFSKAQQEKIVFSTEYPIMERFGQVIKTTGQIESSQGDETIISAKTSGIVTFSSRLTEGKSVTSGQDLFTISGAGMSENNVNLQFVEAQNAFRKAEADYLRVKDLVKDKIVSQKEFLEIQNTYESAKAVYDNLHKNFSSKGQRATASTSGFIKQLWVSNGQFVETGQAMASISQNKSLFLKADVSMKYASLLPFIVSANIRILNQSKVYSLEDLNGKVLSYGKTVGENNYALPVIFQLDNKAELVPGSFVEVYIKTQSNTPVMTLPKSAIVEEQGLYFVFVQLTSDSFEKREVTTGMSDGSKIEIRSGLKVNENVVTQGAVSVKLAQAAGALDPHAGHVH